MPVSAQPLEWLGYTWRPKFSRIAQRALEEAGFDQTKLHLEAVMQGAGAGLTEEMQVTLIWAGQRAQDKHITREKVQAWLTRLGEKGRTILVNWYVLVYADWLLARAGARVSAGLRVAEPKERL